MRGYLQITFGPMFSGKTSHLVYNIHKFLDINEARGTPKKGMIVNSSVDKRIVKETCGDLTTHSSIKRKIKEEIISLKVMNLEYIGQEIIKDIDFIAVDEAQFFTDLHIVERWVTQGKYVHLSGLIADYNKRPFGHLLKLFPIADDIEQLKAFCIYCDGNEMNAPFTRLNATSELESQQLAGGYETYVPVCGKHF